MQRVIFENEVGKVEDLGMQGEYPWSSSVGRKFVYQGQEKERWYSTEINPSGQTLLEYHTNTFIEALQGEDYIDTQHVLKSLGLAE